MKDTDKIRKDMMELWEETFHDSNRYIELIFETYFSSENVFVRYDGDILVASMLCVPYEFQIVSGEKNEKLKGMYLCGLATRPEYRKRGIMKQLMAEAEESIKKRGYDMTFLIPADEHLREYYRRMGYYNGSYRRIDRVEPYKEGEGKNLYIYTFKDLTESGNFEMVKELADWCRERELRILNYPTILHTEKDLLAAISENENSIFLTDRRIDLKYSILADVVGVAFPEVSERCEGGKLIRIVEIFLKEGIPGEKNIENVSEHQLGSISDSICKHFNAENVEFVFTNNEPQEVDSKRYYPYAMVKPIGDNQIFTNNNKPTFRISLMLD